jgi:hypothetical protein
LLVGAQQTVDAVHLRHHRDSGRLALIGLVAPQLDPNRRAHDRFVADQPAVQLSRDGQRGGGRGEAPAHRGKTELHDDSQVLISKPNRVADAPDSDRLLNPANQGLANLEGLASMRCVKLLASAQRLTRRRRTVGERTLHGCVQTHQM